MRWSIQVLYTGPLTRSGVWFGVDHPREVCGRPEAPALLNTSPAAALDKVYTLLLLLTRSWCMPP